MAIGYVFTNDDFFITRLGNGWTMYVRYQNKEHYKRYLDADFGSEDQSKAALRAYRDGLLAGIGYKVSVRSKKQGYDIELSTGVIEITDCVMKSGTSVTHKAIVATHPTIRGKRCRFNYVDVIKRSNQRNRAEAVRLANEVRLSWEAEIGLVKPM